MYKQASVRFLYELRLLSSLARLLRNVFWRRHFYVLNLRVFSAFVPYCMMALRHTVSLLPDEVYASDTYSRFIKLILNRFSCLVVYFHHID